MVFIELKQEFTINFSILPILKQKVRLYRISNFTLLWLYKGLSPAIVSFSEKTYA